MKTTAGAAGEQLVYQLMAKHKGAAFANRWLKERYGKKATPAQTAQANWIEQAKKQLFKSASASRPSGQAAIDMARDLIPDADIKALGRAYYLVVGLLAMALEAGHLPDDDKKCNSYHVGLTYDTLGYIAARAEGRDTPYCSKTVQRWLHPQASHVDALRRYMGARTWFTDTMQNYSTGESIGPVIGCHVVRVYTRPLQGGRVSVMGAWLRRQWRNLQADIRNGRTARARASVTSVHIEKTTLDDVKQAKFFVSDWQQHPREGKTPLLEEHFIYPDTSNPAGLAQLRHDVQQTAKNLAVALGENPLDYPQKRYLAAVWVAVKHEIVNKDPGARRLLLQAVTLADELRADRANTLKDPAAYVWSLIEQRGFREYRRDVPPRLINKSLFEQTMVI